MAELKRTGIDELRLMVQNYNACREGFNTEWTLEQLAQIHRMWMLSGWDIYPDEWHWDQVHAALEGYVPQWDPTTEAPLPLRWQGPWQSATAYDLDQAFAAEEWQEAQRYKY